MLNKKTGYLMRTENIICYLLIAFIAFSLGATLPNAVSGAEDIRAVIDKFYDGLAEIIEHNMNAPEKCLSEVDKYYSKNKEAIKKIRSIAEKSMEEAMAVKDKYGPLSEGDIGPIDAMSAQRGITVPGLTAGSTRYIEALRHFTMRYPQYGMKVAGRTTNFLPGGTEE